MAPTIVAVLVLWALVISSGEGFTQPMRRVKSRCTSLGAKKAARSNSGFLQHGRRAILQAPIHFGFYLGLAQLPGSSASAVVTEKIKKMTPEEAEQRFREGYKSMKYLLDNYDEICQGGGDNVRRYLGTVGTSSGLVGIDKTMKALEDRADDLVEYTETSQEVIKCINQADGSSYMAIFVTTSSSSTPPKKYFDDAKIEIKRGVTAMNDLATMIDLKL